MTPEEVFDRDSIPSPGGWTVPAGERAGWTCSPGRGQPAPEHMPLWVQLWARTPVVDRLGYEVTVWPSPHPDDYEGTPDWGAVLPTLLSAGIADPGSLGGEPDASGIAWLRRPRD